MSELYAKIERLTRERDGARDEAERMRRTRDEAIRRLRAALEQCNEHRDDPHKIIGIVDAALAGMPPYVWEPKP